MLASGDQDTQPEIVISEPVKPNQISLRTGFRAFRASLPVINDTIGDSFHLAPK